MTILSTSARASAPLAGKYALVTGGSRGIGAAIAVQFARKGAEAIAITYVGNKTAAHKVVAEIQSIGSKAIAIQGDTLSNDFGSNVVQGALQGLGTDHLDIIVNNAAIVDINVGEPFFQLTSKGFHMMFQGNVFGPLSVIAAAFPHLPAYGGRIINISSGASREPCLDPLMSYGASKAALDSFTRSIAAKYAAEKHCTINGISVGGTETDAAKAVLDVMGAEVVETFKSKQTAEHRLGKPEDIAMIVAFLASEDARWINGACVPANGGSMISLQG